MLPPVCSTLLLFVAGLGGAWPLFDSPGADPAPSPPAAVALHTYEARIRLGSRVSTTRVQASDAGHARRLVQAQYGDKVTVLSVKRVDGQR